MAGKAKRNAKHGSRQITSQTDNPDLSHIAEALRPLAVPVSELTFMIGNPRTHDAANLTAIKGSLAQFGQLEPLVVNRRPQPPVVLGGNGRLQAALELGWTYLAVCYVNVDEPTAHAIAIALNRTAELGGWDTAALQMRATGGSGSYAWSANGLPPGLTIIESTGQITGTIRTTGTYSVTVTAVAGVGLEGITTFTWTVTREPCPHC